MKFIEEVKASGLASQLESLVSIVLDASILLAAIATVSMAFLEVIKKVFKLKRWYHKFMIERWLGTGTSHHAYRQLLELSIGSSHFVWPLYEQDSEKMMAMIQSSANLAIESPDMFLPLYQFLVASPADPLTNKEISLPEDAAYWLAFMKERRRAILEVEPNQESISKATQARTAVEHRVNRKLDAFQTEIQYHWASYNQWGAFVVSVLLILFLFGMQAWSGNTKVDAPYAVMALVIGIAGGIVAPFAKDVYNALSNLVTKR